MYGAEKGLCIWHLAFVRNKRSAGRGKSSIREESLSIPSQQIYLGQEENGNALTW